MQYPASVKFTVVYSALRRMRDHIGDQAFRIRPVSCLREGAESSGIYGRSSLPPVGSVCRYGGSRLQVQCKVGGAWVTGESRAGYGTKLQCFMAERLDLRFRPIFAWGLSDTMDLKQHIRSIPDFPKPGILFYDISTLLAHPEAWQKTVERLADAVMEHKPDILAGIESRGFLVAAPLALQLGLGFAMVRKKGKLPGKTIPYTYDLEYGSDTIEIQADAFHPGQRVVLLDDLLATGGTMKAAAALLRQAGADVRAAACIIELTFLKGRAAIDMPVTTLVQYDD